MNRTATPFTTVVTGLPRSGTSLAMQMLHAGGMPVLTDHLRQPDEDNPRGYLELEPIKQLPVDPSCLDGSAGHAVKVIHLLVPHLPEDREYRVLFMDRDLSEVIRSQQRMLSRRGNPGSSLPPERLAAVLNNQLSKVRQWLAARPAFPILGIPHARLLKEPAAVAMEINAFLGGGLDVAAMAATVDPSLHRNRGPF